MNPERIDHSTGAVPPAAADDGDFAVRLSCLLDGELDADECRVLVGRVRRDESAGRRWELFSCVGDALRSPDVAAWHSDRFVARVSAALQREPTVLAPAPRAPARRWLLPGAGAAAAAVVLIAVGLPSRQASPPAAVASGAPVTAAADVATASVPVAIERSPRLERYLAAHRELAEPSLMPHSTPYVRTSGTMALQEGK